jgi:hypothetical protein
MAAAPDSGDGWSPNILVRATAACSNHEAGALIQRLACELDGLRTRRAPALAPLTARRTRHRPGWVLKAAREVLAQAGTPMRLADIHTAVEELLQEQVSRYSVEWTIYTHLRDDRRVFVRIARNRYVLANGLG